ncbi:hypothetical protein, partial [Fusobacterium sp. SYSU M8D902]|uniref:hypothetical protein n=1 Tax=Fusobacterium sp. SYSU M8D902 TaxID=3159562 RepID=UPI0032E407B6
MYYDELNRPGAIESAGTKKFLYIRHDNKNCLIETDNYSGGNGPFRCIIKISDWKDKKNFNFTITYLTHHSGKNIGHDSGSYSYRNKYNCYFNVIYKELTLKGQSSLTVREKYPTNQFIQFNSTPFEAGKPLALENSLTDVTFNTSGKGIVTMQEGDLLEIDGKKTTIGVGGNSGVQTATIGDLKYSYKVEAGKLRLALNEWGILEPNHNLMIRVFRSENGTQRKMVEHTLTIDSPRRVEGANNIKIDNNYQIRNVIKFSGISLNAPSSFA